MQIESVAITVKDAGYAGAQQTGVAATPAERSSKE